jgi:hypothetical protein
LLDCWIAGFFDLLQGYLRSSFYSTAPLISVKQGVLVLDLGIQKNPENAEKSRNYIQINLEEHRTFEDREIQRNPEIKSRET